MNAQHAERERAPFDDDHEEIVVVTPTGEVYPFDEADLDRDTLVLAAFRELLKHQDAERQRAAESKASRKAASRYGEVFNSFEGLGATVRDRNLLVNRISEDERAEGMVCIRRRGLPQLRGRIFAYVCEQVLRPEDYTADGMRTAEGRRRFAAAVFHTERWHRAAMVGLGSFAINSVADMWFLTWLRLNPEELGAILTAAKYVADDARTDDDLRRALEMVRKPRACGRRRESEVQVKTRLASVARNRWRHLRNLGAVDPHDLPAFHDLRR